jgi:putative hydrolase of HD superfamily
MTKKLAQGTQFNQDQAKNILSFFFEVGTAEEVRRTGLWNFGIKNTENVAEHSFRVAIITFVLASLEGADAYKLTTYSLFHDIHETRLLDRNAISQKYFPTPNEVVEQMRADQFSPLGAAVQTNANKMLNLSPEEFLIVKDADYMDDGLRAKEHVAQGTKDVQLWIDEVGEILQTASAKTLWTHIAEVDINDWWQVLKKTVEEMIEDHREDL